MIKLNPFNPFIPIETKLRAFRLTTPRREVIYGDARVDSVRPDALPMRDVQKEESGK